MLGEIFRFNKISFSFVISTFVILQPAKNQDCSKNSNCYSDRSEESPDFLFKSKNQKRRSFGLQPQDDTER